MKIIIEIEPKELIELNMSSTKVAYTDVIQSSKKPKLTSSEFGDELLKNISKEINKIYRTY